MDKEIKDAGGRDDVIYGLTVEERMQRARVGSLMETDTIGGAAIAATGYFTSYVTLARGASTSKYATPGDDVITHQLTIGVRQGDRVVGCTLDTPEGLWSLSDVDMDLGVRFLGRGEDALEYEPEGWGLEDMLPLRTEMRSWLSDEECPDCRTAADGGMISEYSNLKPLSIYDIPKLCYTKVLVSTDEDPRGFVLRSPGCESYMCPAVVDVGFKPLSIYLGIARPRFEMDCEMIPNIGHMSSALARATRRSATATYGSFRAGSCLKTDVAFIRVIRSKRMLEFALRQLRHLPRWAPEDWALPQTIRITDKDDYTVLQMELGGDGEYVTTFPAVE
jgi:hypothetical protein